MIKISILSRDKEFNFSVMEKQRRVSKPFGNVLIEISNVSVTDMFVYFETDGFSNIYYGRKLLIM